MIQQKTVSAIKLKARPPKLCVPYLGSFLLARPATVDEMLSVDEMLIV